MNRNNGYYSIFMGGYINWDFTGRMKMYPSGRVEFEIEYRRHWTDMNLFELYRFTFRDLETYYTTFLHESNFVRNMKNEPIIVECGV